MTDIPDADILAIRQGSEAEGALNVVRPHFEALKSALIERWSQSSSSQTDLREKLWQARNAIIAVEQALTELVTNGAHTAEFNHRYEAEQAIAKAGLTRP